MEKLKSAISQTLMLSISQSNPHTLPNTCSSLHDFFNQLPQFHQMVEDLAHKETSLFLKNKGSALEFKLKGNNCFSNGDSSNALQLYTQALRVAPRDVNDKGKNLVATLFVNRAAVLQKMGLVLESLQDCNLALAICKSYSKAWYRRGKANTLMGNYENAVCDLKVSLSMEHSISGKKQIEGEIKLILNQHNGKDFPIPPNDQPHQIQLQCVTTETKGRGMVCLTDIPPATLLHTEEPYAAIISKQFRKSHCHFCFNELPTNIVPCPSCSMALYCSQVCQANSSWQDSQSDMKNLEIGVHLSSDLEKYVESVTEENVKKVHINQNHEHKHECGVNWAAALPSEIVLAGRVIAKHIEQQQGHFGKSSRIVNLDLCHNYAHLEPEEKLELHISSITLLKCLQQFYTSDKFPLNGNTISQCVLLLAQLKVNCMAIIRIKSSDTENPTTSTMEQVRVGEAVYLTGSMFNHSCKPNIHSYFLSRTLNIRAIDFVPPGQPLELSYGPQVGQWSCNERQSSLKNQYVFTCSCASCTKSNLPDLVINSYRCSNLNCFGVVLDRDLVNYENQKVNAVGTVDYNEVEKVASLLCEETESSRGIKPGVCLNCGGYRDIESLKEKVKKSEICKGLLESSEVNINMVSSGLRCLDLLKSVLHPYNKKVAEVEDYMAREFCSIGELQRARDHCEASIKILEKLYGEEHIVIGNELVKLASIQVALGEGGFEESRNRINLIFSRHYGSHVHLIFPHLIKRT